VGALPSDNPSWNVTTARVQIPPYAGSVKAKRFTVGAFALAVMGAPRRGVRTDMSDVGIVSRLVLVTSAGFGVSTWWRSQGM